MIQQNTEKLNNLILELLEFRRLETGNKVLSIQQLSVSEKVRSIAESFEELAENKEMNYQLHISPDIEWNTDISCFNKIVSNLISNAFKYTPDKGIITIELKVENQSLIFCISNSGKGIAKENLSKIFDRYKILDSVEMNGKNSRTGLGLAICKSMITQLNGEISVNSVLYEMTTFTVTLPNLPITERETTQTTYETGLLHTATEEPIVLEKTAIEFDTGKRTIMVIDDDNSMLWFVSELLQTNTMCALLIMQRCIEQSGAEATRLNYFRRHDARYRWTIVCSEDKATQIMESYSTDPPFRPTSRRRSGKGHRVRSRSLCYQTF